MAHWVYISKRFGTLTMTEIQTKPWKNIDDPTLREMAWEREMHATALEKYEDYKRKQNENKTFVASDSAASQSLLQKCVASAIVALRSYQKANLNTQKSRDVKTCALLVPADTLALITVRLLLDKTYISLSKDTGVDITSLSRDLGKLIEAEVRFRTWVEESKERAKEYAKVEGLAKIPKSRAELFMTESGLSTRSIQTIKRNIRKLKIEPWDERLKLVLGVEVLSIVLDNLKEVFINEILQLPDRKVKIVRLSEAFAESIKNKEIDIANKQIIRKPMLIPPKPWVRVEKH